MGVRILAIFLIIIYLDKEHIYGMIKGFMWDSGSIIKWMGNYFVFCNLTIERGNFRGRMEEGILANIKMISSMVMGNFVGLMVENTKEIGKYLYFFM